MRHLPASPVSLALHGAKEPAESFDLDDYLDALAPHLIESFQHRIAGRTLYDLFTRDQVHPIPVTLRAFLEGLTRFRTKVRALDPIQRDLLDNRVARLYPPSGWPTPDFIPVVLPPPKLDGGNPGEAGQDV